MTRHKKPGGARCGSHCGSSSSRASFSFKPGPGGGPVIETPDASNLATTLTLLMQFGQARYQVVSEARQAFEPLMAQLAAQHITATELAELEQTQIDMEPASAI
jgi:GntR family transcriptional regulator, transcriptional repressor for pyruvate dehydrogenase complex